MDINELSEYQQRIVDNIKRRLESSGLNDNSVLLLSFSKDFEVIGEFLSIGDDYGTRICVNLKNHELYSIDIEGKYPRRFINSSIDSFIDFIQIYIDGQAFISNANDDEDKINSIISRMKGKFSTLDNKALSNEENWWSIIIEQMEYGLL